MSIDVEEVSGTALYHRYPRQTSPQRAYVAIDCGDRKLFADTCDEIGNGVLAAIYHGRIQRWTIPALKADCANALLAEIAPLAEIVCDGYSSEWDGSNHVAEFTSDAQDALYEIERLCETAGAYPEDQLQVWDACDWFAGIGSHSAQCRELRIDGMTTDEDLSAIEEECFAELRGCDVDLVEGVYEHLKMLRDECRDNQ
jgi:hypothetical protein